MRFESQVSVMRYFFIVFFVGVFLLIAWALFTGNLLASSDCEDKGGKLITDRYNRTYCVEVIE